MTKTYQDGLRDQLAAFAALLDAEGRHCISGISGLVLGITAAKVEPERPDEKKSYTQKEVTELLDAINLANAEQRRLEALGWQSAIAALRGVPFVPPSPGKLPSKEVEEIECSPGWSTRGPKTVGDIALERVNAVIKFLDNRFGCGGER
jgi:hypothetical protein